MAQISEYPRAHEGTARPPARRHGDGHGGRERVAVIGAGAGGLATAHHLTKAGYAVTVLEREDRVGGKCCTIHHEGRSYELGAAVLSPLYTHVRGLMRDVGLEGTRELSGVFLDLERGKTSYLVPSPARRRWLALAGEVPRYVTGLVAARRLWRPGFDGLAEDMAQPFETWARAHGFSEMVEMVRPWFTGFGYGYLDEIPAAYVLKYMTVCGFPLAELLEGGYQALWERVARPLDVRCSVDVKRVQRDRAGVTIETATERMRFDRLVLACPLDAALSFLDSSAEERSLFSRIRHVDYRVVAAHVEWPLSHRYTFTNHLRSDSRGQPMFWYRRWADSSLHTFYAIGDGAISDEAIVDSVDDTVRRLGGRMGKIVRFVRWRYFPHVDAETMAGGYYRSIEALQGTQRTNYAGELLCFPTVETVAAYSADLVKRFFDARTSARWTPGPG